MSPTYAVARIREWNTLRWLARRFPNYLYRGQRSVGWGLEPSLERACLPLRQGKSLAEVERHIVREFQRGAEAYLSYIPRLPEPTSWLEWLALIQHHGGPTRLLDFTRSIYIAAFFAFDEPGDDDRVIWAVNPGALWRALQQRVPEMPAGGDRSEALFNHYFTSEASEPSAIIIRPDRLNERIGVQQGTFLCSLSMKHTLEENLFGMLGIDPRRASEPNRMVNLSWADTDMLPLITGSPIVKLVIQNHIGAEVLMELAQMNIKHASLFPGLDGYARDLKRHAFWFSEAAMGVAAYAETRTMPDP
jgi:hypothetical protein